MSLVGRPRLPGPPPRTHCSCRTTPHSRTDSTRGFPKRLYSSTLQTLTTASEGLMRYQTLPARPQLMASGFRVCAGPPWTGQHPSARMCFCTCTLRSSSYRKALAFLLRLSPATTPSPILTGVWVSSQRGRQSTQTEAALPGLLGAAVAPERGATSHPQLPHTGDRAYLKTGPCTSNNEGIFPWWLA